MKIKPRSIEISVRGDEVVVTRSRKLNADERVHHGNKAEMVEVVNITFGLLEPKIVINRDICEKG